MTDAPAVLGPLDDPDYIEDLCRGFQEENGRGPYGTDELLRWHRNRINVSLAEAWLRGDHRLPDCANFQLPASP